MVGQPHRLSFHDASAAGAAGGSFPSPGTGSRTVRLRDPADNCYYWSYRDQRTSVLDPTLPSARTPSSSSTSYFRGTGHSVRRTTAAISEFLDPQLLPLRAACLPIFYLETRSPPPWDQVRELSFFDDNCHYYHQSYVRGNYLLGFTGVSQFFLGEFVIGFLNCVTCAMGLYAVTPEGLQTGGGLLSSIVVVSGLQGALQTLTFLNVIVLTAAEAGAGGSGAAAAAGGAAASAGKGGLLLSPLLKATFLLQPIGSFWVMYAGYQLLKCVRARLFSPLSDLAGQGLMAGASSPEQPASPGAAGQPPTTTFRPFMGSGYCGFTSVSRVAQTKRAALGLQKKQMDQTPWTKAPRHVRSNQWREMSQTRMTYFRQRQPKVLFYSFPLAVARMAQKLFRMGARCAAIAFHFSPLLALSIPAFVLWRYSRKYQRLWYGCLLSCVEKCGPAFVKFAQWAATRPDLFPDQLCAHLSELHSCVAPHPLSASLAVCETALVGEMSRLLVLDAGPPVGSGCIAQVHRGRWLNSAAATTSTSQEVAVKILHPGVRESIAADLEILRFLATNVEYLLPCTRFMALSEAVSQFSEILYAQTDLTQEAENTRKFRENFADYSYGRVRFPEIVFAHSDLLVESFEEGRPMQELLRGWEVGDGKSAGRASVEVASNSAVRGGAGTGAATPAPASSQRGRAGGDEVAEDVTLFGRKASAGRWLNLFSWQQEQEDRANKFRRGDEDAGSGNSAPLLQGDAAGRVSPENRPAGVQSTLRKKSRYSNAFLDELSSLALNAYLKMLFHDRFVHADLHPGNMFFKILPNGEPELIFLDCGLSVHLSQKDATNFNDCVYALLHGNPEDAAHLIVKRSPGDPGAVYKQEEFARKVGLLIKDFRKPDSKMHVAHVTGKLLLYAGQHNVTLESCFVNVALSLAVMDGLGRQLKDDFNIFRAATPFLAQAAIRYARGYQ
eukprot:g509.t1